ncbi:MAG: ABC transporter ATP-binding protein [Candidatus Melainabacteria bacterium]|nr:ABC transporter ATP-binding protein [Candidatus Melainabacteria bacterium]
MLNYIRPYSVPFVFGMLAAVPSGSMEALMAWLAGQGLQKIIVEGRADLLVWVPVAVLVIAVLQGLFRFLESYLIRLVGASAIRDLRNDVFCHLERQPLQYFHGNPSGVLIGRVVNDIAVIENAISQTFQTMISRTVTLISLAAVLIYQSLWLSIIALSIFSLILVPVQILGKKIRKASRSGQEAIGELVGVLGESIQGVKVVQSFNLESYQIDRFKETNQNFLDATMKAVRNEALMSPVLAQIGAVGIAAVIWVAGDQVIHGHMTVGALTSFTIALMLLYSPLKTIGRVNGIIQPALAAAERVFDVLDDEPALTDSENTVELPRGSHDIKFAHVYFKYPGHEELVLEDIDLLIPAGKMIALVGNSGAGKSTIANLVPRFFDPTAGAILIDGRPLPEYDLYSLRNQIAVVTQDNFLFNTTVGENIMLGNTKASQEQIVEAARAAYCHDFICELPRGYDTMIGERGMRLSGGQQQRLAIARAILKDAPILILDEATSSLDNESEAMVQQALNNLMQGRTVIVIAHRLSTIRHADEILVLENGKIIESGNHEELVSRDQAYARLLEAQFQRTT